MLERHERLPTPACQTSRAPVGEAAKRPAVIAEERQRAITQVEESFNETTIKHKSDAFGRRLPCKGQITYLEEGAVLIQDQRQKILAYTICKMLCLEVNRPEYTLLCVRWRRQYRSMGMLFFSQNVEAD